MRACARALGVSAASVCHVAWARVLAAVSGRDDVVFGTVLFGRMQGGQGVGRALGMFVNTLPIRLSVSGEGARDSVRQAHELLGRLFRHERRPVEAAAELERAVSLARRGAGLVEWAYALTTLADLRREMGDRRGARDLVLEARQLLSRAPEPGTLALRLLGQLESTLRLVVDRSGPRPIVTDELTAREQTVLGLLPTGLSAREIGDELGISRDTVKTHIKRVYNKLGVSSRRSAVARGRELGLL